MYGENKAPGSSTVDPSSIVITIEPEHSAVIRRASPHRLAELVHHLSDASVSEARRAVHQTNATCDERDPLTIVAAALLQLRRDARRCTTL